MGLACAPEDNSLYFQRDGLLAYILAVARASSDRCVAATKVKRGRQGRVCIVGAGCLSVHWLTCGCFV